MKRGSTLKLPKPTSSYDSAETPSPQSVRASWLPKVLLARGLFRVQVHRLMFVRALLARVDSVEPKLRGPALLDVTYQTWNLVDNLLAGYEAISDQLKITDSRDRKNIQARVGGRTSTPGVGFHKGIWYRGVLATPDEEFVRRGLDPGTSRQILQEVVQRSCDYLKGSYETLRSFHSKYRAIATAYKHGRALFPVQLSEVSPGKFTWKGSENVFTVFRGIGDNSETLVELQTDGDLKTDFGAVLTILANQIPRLAEFFDSMVEACKGYAEWLEDGESAFETVPVTLNFFAEPYSPQEAELLEKLRSTKTPRNPRT